MTLKILEAVFEAVLLMVVVAWAAYGFVMWLNSASFESRARRFREWLK